MGNRFAELAFTDAVKDVQTRMGSRRSYARLEGGAATNRDLTADEIEFISQRDSFYMASISETGWPYIQHRGGAAGFVQVLSNREIGFADFSGNRQYITVGNLQNDPRVALIMVDYPNRARLKLLGTARLVDSSSDPVTMQHLSRPAYQAKVERGIVIHVDAYDWNCPQHLTPRWTAEEIHEAVWPLQERIQQLEAENEALRRRAKTDPA